MGMFSSGVAFDEAHPPCGHGDTSFAIRTLSNGQTRYVVQCDTCGRQMETLSRAAATDLMRDFGDELFVPWDESLSDRYWQERRTLQQTWVNQLRAEESEKWWAEHDAYLNSDEWRRRRRERLAMDDGQCQARLPGCKRTASDVHHLTYAHWRNEPLFDLISVCRPCHEQITQMDREGRRAA